MAQWWSEIGDLMSEVSWPLLITICLLGGLLAWLGDRVGMKFAKKKVSLFGLRPRYTGSLITAVTGLFIALLVMASLALTSDTVRTALFSMKYLANQTQQLTVQLQKSREDQQQAQFELSLAQSKLADAQAEAVKTRAQVAELRDEAETARKNFEQAQSKVLQAEKALQEAGRQKKNLESAITSGRAKLEELQNQQTRLKTQLSLLKHDLTRIQEEAILVFAGERIASKVIPADADRATIKQVIAAVRAQARYEVGLRENRRASDVEDRFTAAEEEKLISKAETIKGRRVVTVTVTSNMTRGDALEAVYDVKPSRLVYHKGDQIHEGAVPLGLDEKRSELYVLSFLADINKKARRGGVEGDPLTGAVGDYPTSRFYALVARLQHLKKPARLKAVTLNDVYTEDPVRLELTLEDEK